MDLSVPRRTKGLVLNDQFDYNTISLRMHGERRDYPYRTITFEPQ